MVALGSSPDTIPQSFIILHLHYLVSPKATVGEGQCLLPPMLLNMYNLLLYYTEVWFWSNILACLYFGNINNIISILFPGVYLLRTHFSFQNTAAFKEIIYGILHLHYGTYALECNRLLFHEPWNPHIKNTTTFHLFKIVLYSYVRSISNKIQNTIVLFSYVRSISNKIQNTIVLCAASATKQQQNSVFAPSSKHVVILIKVSTMVKTSAIFHFSFCYAIFVPSSASQGSHLSWQNDGTDFRIRASFLFYRPANMGSFWGPSVFPRYSVI